MVSGKIHRGEPAVEPLTGVGILFEQQIPIDQEQHVIPTPQASGAVYVGGAAGQAAEA